MKIKDAKLFEPLTVKSDENLQVIAKKMREFKVRHAYVVDEEEQVIGVISVVDICNKVVAENKEPSNVQAKEIMASPVVSKEVNDHINDAYETMVNGKHYSLPITQDNKLVGILPMNQAVALMLGQKNE